MKYNLLFAILILLFVTNLNAQYSLVKAKDIPEMQTRPLIVELLEIDDDLIEKREKKPEGAVEYQNKSDK